MRERRRNSLLVGLLGIVGCYPVWKTFPGEEESGTGSSGVVTTGASGGAVTTGVVGPAGSGGSSGAAEASAGSTHEEQTFIVMSDAYDDIYACDPYVQDCPPGQKCTMYAMHGGSSWNATKCVPVMEGPVGVGEECFVVGSGVSGIDNCDATSYCWDTNAENLGYCVGICTGSAEAPVCPSGMVPVSLRSVNYCFCYDGCDPLSQDCAMEDDVCIPFDYGFLCTLDASGEGGQVHDPCEFANACDPGLICLNSTAAVECDLAASGCCEPFCDLTLANTCPGQGQVCTPYYAMGEAPVGYEKVGFCVVP